jgi:hypothetical protein
MKRTLQTLRELQACNIYQKIDHAAQAIENFCKQVQKLSTYFNKNSHEKPSN